MTLLLVLLGCLFGLYLGRRDESGITLSATARLCAIASVGILGSLIGAAELDGMVVHCLGLAAVALAAAAIGGGFAVAGQDEQR